MNECNESLDDQHWIILPTNPNNLNRCGPDGNGEECPSGECCSKNGICGTGKAYCGQGCQSEFGKCLSNSNDSKLSMVRCNGNNQDQQWEITTINPNIPRCGSGIGSCPSGQCCNRDGLCGTGNDYCGKGCQSQFGKCNPTTTRTTTTTTTTKKTTTTTTTKKTTTTTTKKTTTTTKKTTTTTKKTTTTTKRSTP
ncbi:hypothetical protein BCR32DRAFT_299413, partial [Anaeromyces robustus]